MVRSIGVQQCKISLGVQQSKICVCEIPVSAEQCAAMRKVLSFHCVKQVVCFQTFGWLRGEGRGKTISAIE